MPSTEIPDDIERRRIAAGSLACADLVDALTRRGHDATPIRGLVSPTPGRILFGPAVTMTFFPAAASARLGEPPEFRTVFREAVGTRPEGSVLVISAPGHRGVSVGGGTKLARAEHYGLEGVLTDGGLRDFEELRDFRFATYCADEAVVAGGHEIAPHLAGVPVVIGGVGILPGDYVFADASGAVVVPPGDVDGVLEAARGAQEEDAGFRVLIAQERESDGASTAGSQER